MLTALHKPHRNRPAPSRFVLAAETERALWIGIGLLALTLRLVHLDAALLGAPEAREAMLAWRAVNGLGMPEGAYSPMLFAANALLFILFGAGDAVARLWPALFGSLLVMTPWLLRGRIGRVGALAAGLYLALSPTALFASRQVDGAVIAAAGGMVLLGGAVRFFEIEASEGTGERFWLVLAAVGLALALTSSPLAYGLLLPLAAAWLGSNWWVWPEGGERWRWLGETLRSHSRHLLVVCLVGGLLLATGFGWNPAGLGATGDLLATWLGRFGAASGTASPFALLTIYEPLALLFGLGGLAWAWAARKGRRFGVLLGLWAGLGFLLLMLMPGRAPLDVLVVVLPLALLAGVATEALVRSLQTRRILPGEWLYLPVVLVVWVHFYLRLARYGAYGKATDLLLALLTLVLQCSLAIVSSLAIDVDTILRTVVTGTGILLLIVTFSTGWGVAHVRPADPRELLVQEPTALEVQDLVQTLRELSWRETGFPTTMAFALEAAPDSTLAWYLRDFQAARRVSDLRELEDLLRERHGIDSVLVVYSSSEGEDMRSIVPEGDEYVGQVFDLQRSWPAETVACIWVWPPQCNSLVKWVLFRDAPAPPGSERQAVLWSSLPGVTSHSH